MITNYLITTIILLLLARGFFSAKIKFASWHMFTQVNRILFYLKQDDKNFNVWDILPHSHIAMDLEELAFFLEFCKFEKNIILNGKIIYINGFVIKKYKITNSHITKLN